MTSVASSISSWTRCSFSMAGGIFPEPLRRRRAASAAPTVVAVSGGREVPAADRSSQVALALLSARHVTRQGAHFCERYTCGTCVYMWSGGCSAFYNLHTSPMSITAYGCTAYGGSRALPGARRRAEYFSRYPLHTLRARQPSRHTAHWTHTQTDVSEYGAMRHSVASRRRHRCCWRRTIAPRSSGRSVGVGRCSWLMECTASGRPRSRACLSDRRIE